MADKKEEKLGIEREARIFLPTSVCLRQMSPAHSFSSVLPALDPGGAEPLLA